MAQMVLGEPSSTKIVQIYSGQSKTWLPESGICYAIHI